MKKLFLTAVLATLAGAPAFAQSFNPGFGTGNVEPFAYAPQANHGGFSAYAQDTTGSIASRPARRMHGSRAIGADPDPNIQFELNREVQEGY